MAQARACILLTTAEACDLLRIGRTTLWKLERTDVAFPKAITHGQRLKRWRQTDLEAYIETQARS